MILQGITLCGRIVLLLASVAYCPNGGPGRSPRKAGAGAPARPGLSTETNKNDGIGRNDGIGGDGGKDRKNEITDSLTQTSSTTRHTPSSPY